jgi:hypothetical protein
MSLVRVLFLASNPLARSKPLDLDQEIRQIMERIRAAAYPGQLDLSSRWAVRPTDLLQALNEIRPHIVHFSGHASRREGIILEGDSGKPTPVPTEALVSLFQALKDNIRVVLLNACSTNDQAESIAEIVDCTIGMDKPIGDKAAITFAAWFYSAIGFGRSVQEAFNQGKTALLLQGIAESATPKLFARTGTDPSRIVLIDPLSELVNRKGEAQIVTAWDANGIIFQNSIDNTYASMWQRLESIKPQPRRLWATYLNPEAFTSGEPPAALKRFYEKAESATAYDYRRVFGVYPNHKVYHERRKNSLSWIRGHLERTKGNENYQVRLVELEFQAAEVWIDDLGANFSFPSARANEAGWATTDRNVLELLKDYFQQVWDDAKQFSEFDKHRG